MNLCRPAGFITETIVDACTSQALRLQEGKQALESMLLAALAPSSTVNVEQQGPGRVGLRCGQEKVNTLPVIPRTDIVEVTLNPLIVMTCAPVSTTPLYESVVLLPRNSPVLVRIDALEVPPGSGGQLLFLKFAVPVPVPLLKAVRMERKSEKEETRAQEQRLHGGCNHLQALE